MLRAGDTADEFDCNDCGRHIISSPAGSMLFTGGRCAACFSLPGWFLVPELRRIWEPDGDWEPPRRAPGASGDPSSWRCEVPGCGCNSPLLRVSGYDEPFRGRCADHLHPSIYRRLHRQRNTERRG
jgi:hypothetical protein